jgi:hypothetical protein
MLKDETRKGVDTVHLSTHPFHLSNYSGVSDLSHDDDYDVSSWLILMAIAMKTFKTKTD